MVIQHNMAAMNSSRQLGITTDKQTKSTEKLSSGYRINRAADDAAGLAISEKMRGQIRGLTQASTNSEDGISLIQTAEGALQETQNVIHRMRELAVQAANDTNTDDDRTQIQKEIKQLTNEVDRIATSTEFNTRKLLDGSQKGNQEAREGLVSVEGSFQSGAVSLVNTSSAALCAIDDVLRLTIQMDITSADDLKLYEAVSDGAKISFDSLQGVQWAHQIDAEEEDDALVIKIPSAVYPSRSDVSDTATTASEDLTFKIEDYKCLKAGDTITIAMEKAVSSKPVEGEKDPLRFQVGANAGQEVTLGINSMKAKDLGIVQTSSSVSEGSDENTMGAALDVTVQAKASLAIEAYDQALTKVSTQRAKLGAVQNRLEHTIANLDTSAENLQASESRIRDVDMADEMVEFSKSNILQQAGTSMLSNANSSTQTVLQLLQQ
jgi:flagellin